ncbi:hypothetical protein FQZ97_970560 [compost metagenome]
MGRREIVSSLSPRVPGNKCQFRKFGLCGTYLSGVALAMLHKLPSGGSGFRASSAYYSAIRPGECNQGAFVRSGARQTWVRSRSCYHLPQLSRWPDLPRLSDAPYAVGEHRRRACGSLAFLCGPWQFGTQAATELCVFFSIGVFLFAVRRPQAGCYLLLLPADGWRDRLRHSW